MTEELIKDVEEKMNKAVEFLVSDLSTLRAGRATPNLLDKVLVNYYGQPTPLKQMANISAPEARLLVVQPWDKGVLPEVEKAIMKSDLGITPSSDGVVIRLAIPALTEERRKDLVKIVKKKGEESKVAVRNIRREANEEIKNLGKSKQLSEDAAKSVQDEVQELTNKFVDHIDDVIQNKEKEIMEI